VTGRSDMVSEIGLVQKARDGANFRGLPLQFGSRDGPHGPGSQQDPGAKTQAPSSGSESLWSGRQPVRDASCQRDERVQETNKSNPRGNEDALQGVPEKKPTFLPLGTQCLGHHPQSTEFLETLNRARSYTGPRSKVPSGSATGNHCRTSGLPREGCRTQRTVVAGPQ
jgi:hypothetical protein